MKKKKTMLLVSLLALLATGCGEKISGTEVQPDTQKQTEENKTESSTVKTTDYYLAGNVDLGDDSEKKFAYDDKTKTYTLSGISLKRGDAFFVRGLEGLDIINYDSLVSQTGFEKGNGNYICVLNEGIYDLAIQDGSLSLVKTASNYHDVKIVYEDGKESLDFVIQDDFTFVLEDAPIRYRQKFYIDMDGEKLGFDSLGFNEAYYKAFRFDDNSIESIKKGNFDFTIDFSLKQPLVITSEEIQDENTAPVDGDAYYRYIKKFNDQFADKGSKFTMTTEVTSGDTISKEVIEETLDLNQHYIQSESYSYSADQSMDGAITEEKGKEKSAIEKREAVFNSTNYYEIATFDGTSTNKPTVTGAIIGEDEDVEPTESTEENTMVYRDRNYVTKDEAYDKMISYQSEYKSINSYLNYMIAHAHISGTSTLTDQQIKDNLQVEYEYLGDIGDAIKIKFTNYEMVYNSYSTSYYATDELEITVSEDGLLTDGIYQVNVYSGKVFDSDKKVVDNLEDFLTKSEKHTFHMDYEDRKDVTDFSISIESNVASEIEPVIDEKEVSSKVTTLQASDFGILAVTPASPLDLENFKIMAYDSKYFTENYNKTLSGRGVIGTTVLTIGNEYNMVTCDVTVTLTYEDYTNNSQFGSLYCNDKSFTGGYVNETYDLVLTPYSGYNPADIEITASSDAITISDMNSDEDKKTTGKVKFKLTMNRAESGVSLKLASKSNPSITRSIALTISEPWTTENAAAVYCNSATYSITMSEVVLKSDGTGTVNVGTSFSSYTQHSFNYAINATGAITLVSSDTITELSMSMQTSKSVYTSSTGSDKIEHKCLKVEKLVIGGENKASGYNNSFIQVTPIFDGDNYTIVDESGTNYTFVKREMSGWNTGIIYFTDGTKTSKFTMTGPSEYSYYSAKASSYYDDITNSSYTTYSGSYAYTSGVYVVTFGSKVFTFTPNK